MPRHRPLVVRRGATDPATFEYYGFAKDAVSWAHFPGNAPADLTVEQLRAIYSCVATNWNQVGGQDATIVRYLPPTGSGTRSFFVGTVLGAEPSTDCGTVKTAGENDGSAVPAEDRDTAILPYSVAQWWRRPTGPAPTSATLVARSDLHPADRAMPSRWTTCPAP